MFASWESTSPRWQPVGEPANRVTYLHLTVWSLFSTALFLRDDSNSGWEARVSEAWTGAKIILCALLYIHNFHSRPRAWQPQILNTAELSPSVAALRLPRQSYMWLRLWGLVSRERLRFIEAERRCARWMSLQIKLIKRNGRNEYWSMFGSYFMLMISSFMASAPAVTPLPEHTHH